MSMMASAASGDAAPVAAPRRVNDAAATKSRRETREGLSASVIAGYSASDMLTALLRSGSITAVLALAITAAPEAQTSPANRPRPPGLQKVSADSPALKPEDA